MPYVIIDRETGTALSWASELPDPLPTNMRAVQVARFPQDGELWDASSRRIMTRKERLVRALAASMGYPEAVILEHLNAVWEQAQIE